MSQLGFFGDALTSASVTIPVAQSSSGGWWSITGWDFASRSVSEPSPYTESVPWNTALATRYTPGPTGTYVYDWESAWESYPSEFWASTLNVAPYDYFAEFEWIALPWLDTTLPDGLMPPSGAIIAAVPAEDEGTVWAWTQATLDAFDAANSADAVAFTYFYQQAAASTPIYNGTNSSYWSSQTMNELDSKTWRYPVYTSSDTEQLDVLNLPNMQGTLIYHTSAADASVTAKQYQSAGTGTDGNPIPVQAIEVTVSSADLLTNVTPTPADPELVSILITPQNRLYTSSGEPLTPFDVFSFHYFATGYYSDNTFEDLTMSVTWSVETTNASSGEASMQVGDTVLLDVPVRLGSANLAITATDPATGISAVSNAATQYPF